MTTFHWVRHGPTHATTMVGWQDLPADLSDIAQLDRLNALLPQDAVVISSDLTRARTTADVLGRTRLACDARLREFNFGAWDGRAFDDIARTDPDLSRRYWDTPGDIAPPDGESWNAAAARISPAVAELIEKFEGRHIICVAHYGTILTQVQSALGLSPAQAMRFKIANLSVTTLNQVQGAWMAQRINHVP